MRYWFEEPYETFSELTQLYDQHVHDLRERRFVAIDNGGQTVGVVELIELDYIHRRGEFQIIIAPLRRAAATPPSPRGLLSTMRFRC
jgi:hypothetical protein